MRAVQFIRYRWRALFLLCTLLPAIYVYSVTSPKVFATNEPERPMILRGTQYNLIQYKIIQQTLPQGVLHAVIPITPFANLNDSLTTYVDDQIKGFKSSSISTPGSGFATQFSITPLITFVDSHAISLSMQTEKYIFDSNVQLQTTSWVATSDTVYQVHMTDDLANELAKASLQDKAMFTSQKSLAFGVLPNYTVRLYADTQPASKYAVDIPLEGTLKTLVSKRLFFDYPNQLSTNQLNGLHRRYNRIDKSSLVANCQIAKCIALTFDDGPSPKYTPLLLEKLRQYSAKATFFVLGNAVEKYPQIVIDTVNNGHSVQNHTYSHPYLTRIKNTAIKTQISQTQDILKKIGITTTMVRPPYGAYNFDVQRMSGMPLILWNVDAQEWRNSTSAQDTATRIAEKSRDKAIVLMHDTQSITTDSIDSILQNLQERGYTFVTVDELLGGTLQQNGRYYSGN